MRRRPRRASFSPPPVIQKRRMPLSVLENVDSNSNKLKQRKQIGKSEKFSFFLDIKKCNYGPQILENLYEAQVQNDTLQEIVQSGVTTEMRSLLVEWMFSLCSHFKTPQDIIFIAISILDRALCKLRTDKEKFQLLGATCVHIAVKLHSSFLIEIRSLIRQCGQAYKASDFLQCESDILNALEFDVRKPNISDFISIYDNSLKAYAPFHSLVLFLEKMQLQFSSFLRFKASTVAAAILIYSVHCFNEPINQPFLIALAAREDWKELFRCIEELVRVLMEIIGKTKTTVLEKLQPNEFKKMKKSVGVPSIISFEEYFTLFPNLKLF